MTNAGTAIAPHLILRKSGPPSSRGLPMSIIKLSSLLIALGALLVVAPSVGNSSMNGLPDRPQIGFLIQPGGKQLTDPVSPITAKPDRFERFASIISDALGFGP